MLKTQIVFALRAVLKNRSWFFINIIGFSLAFAIAFMIFSWAGFELSYDNFYNNRNRIYRILEKQNLQGQDEHYLAQVPEYLANTFEEDIPEIEASSCLLRTGNLRIKLNKEIIEIDNVLFADNKVFDIFTFDFIAGNPKNALTEPFSAVLTQSTAKKLFDSEEFAVGKTIELENKKTYTIKGIIKDIPQNSHLQFNILLSLEERKPGWDYKNGNHNASCYVLLKPNADVKSINPKLQLLVKKWLPYNADFISFQLQPLKDIHLDSTFTIWEINWNKFDRKYVNAFIIVALLILIIVISNYINLTLAYSTRRNMEIGLKKIVGSKRSTLIIQFFIETSLMILISLLIASLLYENGISFLQKTILKGYNFHYSDSSLLFYASIILVILIVELSGIYPSLILTSFSPVSVIKNNFTRHIKGHILHKTLTVIQFVITIILIISLSTVAKQVNYLKTKDLGYNTENVILLTANDYIKNHYDEIKADLLSNPSILDVTFSNTRLSGFTWRNSIDFEGRQADTRWEMPYMAVDFNFVDFYKMEIVNGRGFSPDLTPDKQGTAFIINESLAKKLDYKNPVGKKFRNGETGWGEIVGVVKDFNYSSLHDAIEPILFYPSRNYLFEISIKTIGSNLPATLKFLESKWAVYNPDHTFRYSFLNKTIEQLYTKEEDARRLIILFSAVSIFLSIIGLFGMVRFFVKKRTKEIGIRKINGARVTEILAMLNAGFVKWVTVAFIIACPVSWYIMHKWLQNFAYKTELSWWIFALSGIIALGIALLTVSWQSWWASTRNPVEALRYE
jgi:putative ABC transport system permease protein